MLANAENMTPHESKLSYVDRLLFCAAALIGNVNVMTEDNALRDAINAKCGTGRIRTSREKHQKRNGHTAWFISVLTGRDEPWWRMDDGRTVYRSGDSVVAVLGITNEDWGTVYECSIDKPGAAAAIGAYYRACLPDGYCPCGSKDGKPFWCTCIGNYYGNDLDNGLEKDGAWKFLGSLPKGERRELQDIEWSFRRTNL